MSEQNRQNIGGTYVWIPDKPDGPIEMGKFRWSGQDAATRIAQLEREVSEQARLNGMGSEREAALLSKVAQLERELAEARQRAEAREVDWIKACGELSAATRRAEEAEDAKHKLEIEAERLSQENANLLSRAEEAEGKLAEARKLLSIIGNGLAGDPGNMSKDLNIAREIRIYMDASAALAATVRKEGNQAEDRLSAAYDKLAEVGQENWRRATNGEPLIDRAKEATNGQ